VRRIGIGVVCAVGVCAAALAGSSWAAPGGTVSGTISSPSGTTPSSLGVEAVNSSGVIGGVGSLNARGAFRVKVPAGVWLLSAESDAAGALSTTLFSPVRVGGGRTTTARPKTVDRAWRSLRAQAATKKLPRGAVVTVDQILMEDDRDFTDQNFPNLDFTIPVTNDLYSACSSHGITFVDTSTSFLKFAQQESGLSRAHQLAVPFAFKPITPQYHVSSLGLTAYPLGQAGAITTNSVGVALGLINTPLKPVRVNRDFNRTVTDADVRSVVAQATAELAREMC
jgi:hypothetical protein